jgi:site-specific DNA-methyltransferase (adenine-specific)
MSRESYRSAAVIDRILWGDSIAELRAFPEECVHAIISDIPYGIAYDAWDVLHSNANAALGGASAAQREAGSVFRRRGKPLNGWSSADKAIPAEYQAWCATWASQWLRVLKPGGSCLLFAGRRYAHRCVVALEDAGFTFKDMLAWEKPTAPHRAQRVSQVYRRRGDVQSALRWADWRVGNLRPLFEPILWLQKPYPTGGTLADTLLTHGVGGWNEAALKGFAAQDGGTDLADSNILRIAAGREDHGLHPAQKPLRLMERLVSLVTPEGATVLDPFAGSGTTCLAAKRQGRRFIGIEVDANFARIAQERVAME